MKRFDIYGEIWQMSEYLIARKEKTGGTDYPRQDLGELAVRMPAKGTFQRSRELQLFSGFRILNNFWPRTEKLSAIDPEKEPVHIDLLRVRGDFNRPENQELGIGAMGLEKTQYPVVCQKRRKKLVEILFPLPVEKGRMLWYNGYN